MAIPVVQWPGRTRFLVAAAAACASLALYVWCAGPTVTYRGDCGELIVASYFLGISHPTGYPFYCLLARLFAGLLPWGEVAWRYNIFSGVAGAAAVGLVVASIERVVHPAEHEEARRLYDYLPSAGAGLLLAGFYFLGGQCLLAEVYSLNALLLAALIYCAVAWHQDNDWRWAYTVMLLLGLAFNTHLSCVFLLPGLALFGLVQHRRRFHDPGAAAWARVLTLGAVFVGAAALTLYLPLRAGLLPDPHAPGVSAFDSWTPFNWGHPADFAAWKYHVTAQQYRSLLMAPHSLSIAGHAVTFPWFKGGLHEQVLRLLSILTLVTLQYLWAAPVCLWGCIQAFKRSPGGSRQVTGGWFGGALLLTLALNFGIESNYDVGDLSNFFFPSYIVIGIWTGLGLHALFQAMTRAGDNLARATAEPVWRWRVQTFTWLALAGTVAGQWWLFITMASFRGITSARDSALDRAAAASRLASTTGRTPVLLLLSDDSQLPFWYVHHVLGAGPRAITPYGPRRHAYQDSGRLLELVNQLRPAGPIALTQWDEAVASRYPYVMLNQSGSLCLASDRALPEPAQLGDAPAGGPAVTRARFVRNPVYHEETLRWPAADLGLVTESDRALLEEEGLAVLKREDLAAFEVEAVLPPRRLRPLATDAVHHAVQVGWIEVLLARRGELTGPPPPGQQSISRTPVSTPRLFLWKQRRRLVVPVDALRHPGAAFYTAVPLQLETQATIGPYDVWTRLIYQDRDNVTPWQRTDIASLSFR